MDNLTIEDLENLSKQRLKDAEVLYAAGRYDGAFYICGYAVELALKKKICITLGWDGYPGRGKGSEKYKSFKTHKFEDLLHFSGVEKKINKQFLSEWSIVMKWDPEIRYSSKKQTDGDAENLINSAKILLKCL
ncbi:MAG: hypothetical protein KR126chlam5_01128 [Candidatus Anoxychlamydiales bacterium]|nr:hypothetical protein [Candidatus Anoxychlamydiales bacterium]